MVRRKSSLLPDLDAVLFCAISIVSPAGQAPPAFNMLSAVPTPAVAPMAPGLALPGMLGLQNAGLGALGGAVAEPIGVPTECLLLKNMFDPSTEVTLLLD